MKGLTNFEVNAVRKIVAEIMQIDVKDLQDNNLFVEDYNADSLAQYQIVTEIEKRLGVKIVDSLVAEMTSVEGVCAAVRKSMLTPRP